MSNGIRLWLKGLIVAVVLGGSFPAAAQELTRTPFDDWILRCTQMQPERCEIRQRLVNDQNKQILDIRIGFDASQQAYPMVLELPLGFLLQPGVTFKVDEIEEFAGLPVRRCLPTGCMVEIAAPVELISAMRRGNQGAFIVQTPEGKSLALVVSLRGLTAAMNEMIARNSRN